ncbi:MAG: HAD family hydrolase [Ruminococcus sp.]|nr:HAD family hydrolase [Ruminococcus sp.]
MIKLIATDLDGTLLDDEKRLPEGFGETIDRLREQGVRFAFASGRSFISLKQQFAEYLDRLICICDNGAYVWYDGRTAFTSCLEREQVLDMVRFCGELGLLILLCGRNATYHNSFKAAHFDEISKYYTNQVRLDDLTAFDDEIYKIAVFDEKGIEEKTLPKLMSRYGRDFNVALSGKFWVDIMAKEASKGQALRKLQNRLGVSYEETMSFGDYLNDIDLLENAYYSFAVENSHPLVRKAANFSTGSNNDGSVMKEVCELCFEKAAHPEARH